jgi:hypothetical protein
MIRIFVTIGAAFLAGCAGVVEMREEGPFATFSSAQPPDAIAACISEAWTMQKVGFMTPDVRINPISGGKQVMIYNAHGMSPDAIADITSDGSSSRIAYYAKHRESFKKQFSALISPCL